MNRIIAIYGHEKCGKSSSINYTRELLRENGESLSSNPPYKGDKCETFRYKDMIVCICPGGDTKEVVDANFKYAISKDADVVITGSRSKGAPAAKVNEYANRFGVRVEWYKKSVEYYLSDATKDLCNQEYGQMIIGVL